MAYRRAHAADVPICWIDTETGGLDTSTAALLEVAVIITDSSGRDVRNRWEAKLLPFADDVIEDAAAAINGYNAEHWKLEALVSSAAFMKLSGLARGCNFGAHNVPYDYAMIMRFLKRHGMRDWPGPHWKVDTVSMAWPLMANRLVPDLKLTTLTKYLGIPHEHAHTAMADCEAARLLYVDLMAMFDPIRTAARVADLDKVTRSAEMDLVERMFGEVWPEENEYE